MREEWLDSLSEDWESQNGNSESGSAISSLPPSRNESKKITSHMKSSRLPVLNRKKNIYTSQTKAENSWNSKDANKAKLVAHNSERLSNLDESMTENGNNIFSGTPTYSSIESLQNTVQHKPQKNFLQKNVQDFPERRLELPDLFSPNKLETIFDPPLHEPNPPYKALKYNHKEFDKALPSKTPSSPSPRHDQNFDCIEENYQKRDIKYQIVDDRTTKSSLEDTRISDRPHPVLEREVSQETMVASTSHIENCENLIRSARRIFSSQSDLKNEELSQIQVEKPRPMNSEMNAMVIEIPLFRPRQQSENLGDEISLQKISRYEKNDDSTAKPKNLSEILAHESQPTNTQDVSLRFESVPKLGFSTSNESVLPEESLQASTPKQLLILVKNSSICKDKYNSTNSLFELPKTPSKSFGKSKENELKSSPKSPLKIFEPHDTYTNKTLHLRVDQLEDQCQNENKSTTACDHKPKDPNIEASCNEKLRYTDKVPPKALKNYSSFGVGQLDSYQFSEDASYNSSRTNSCQITNENVLPSIHSKSPLTHKSSFPRIASKGDTEQLFFQEKLTNEECYPMGLKSFIENGKSVIGSSPIIADRAVLQKQKSFHISKGKKGDLEGKRLPKTPSGDPEPKRRRTSQMNNKDLDLETKQIDSNLLTKDYEQRNLKFEIIQQDESSHNNELTLSPKISSNRHIIEVGTHISTPNHLSGLKLPCTLSQGINTTSNSCPNIRNDGKVAKPLENSHTKECLNYSHSVLTVGQPMSAESLKGSVTTVDFVNEARIVMADLRKKTRPQSRLTSLGASDLERDQYPLVSKEIQRDELDDSYQESTQEPFSRPPSRDGAAPISRLQLQDNPVIRDYLQKFQESDFQSFFTASLESIASTKDASKMAKEISRLTEEKVFRANTQRSALAHTENLELKKRKYSHCSALTGSTANFEVDYPSHGSNESLTQSNFHSIPTGSSRGSNSCQVIKPKSISHLIPEKVAEMIYDDKEKVWVKNSTKNKNSVVNISPSDETEEDPFGDISDLSVDETLEKERIKSTIVERSGETRISRTEHTFNDNNFILRSSIKMDNINHKTHSSSCVQSYLGDLKDVRACTPTYIERPHPKVTPKRRNVTISFSSPIASVIGNQNCPDTLKLDNGGEDSLDFSKDSVNESSPNGKLLIKNENNSNPFASNKFMSSRGGNSRQISIDGHKFFTRPISRIEEQDEETDSLSNKNVPKDVSIVVADSKPSNRVSSVVLATPRISHEIGTLTLTPLSDFTVHQANKSLGLDVSYIAHPNCRKPDNSKKTLSLSIKEMIERITEVEPYEPFWEHLKNISLKDKQLRSVHKLEEFCQRLESLDISNNQISHLDGVPKTVRNLYIINNCINDMTAWGHLINLQYVDVSNNQLDSLSSLKSLIHMRSLRADKNRIISLEGIDQLDGLLTLRLRGNKIHSINFRNTKLHLLTDLDLRDNQVSRFENFQELQSLTSLDLVDNALTTFSVGNCEPLGSIKHLRLSGNCLEHIDVSQYPNLRLLYLDRNRLGRVTGLLKSKYLDSLSLRGQHNSILDSSFLPESFEIRKIFLSSNLLNKFEPQTDFLNLQFLELANCGLENLPTNFGLMLANVRVLNLNFNALTDIRSIFGILRLKKLHLAGNRLLGLDIISKLLSRFPTLSSVDLRSNPLTLGFYSPINDDHETLNENNADKSEIQEPYTMTKTNKIKDELYKSCLDLRTQMKRRIYEMYMIGSVPRLKSLDGLSVDKSILTIKDGVYHSMVEAGFITRPFITSNSSRTESSNEQEQQNYFQEPEGREKWSVEDSFA